MAGQQGSSPYLRSARFAGEAAAGKAYFAVEELVANVAGDVDLSVYRFIRYDVWHVAVVGDAPPGQLRQQIEAALAAGELVRLDRATRRWLRQRRAEQSSQAPWVERHYRPGRGFHFQ